MRTNVYVDGFNLYYRIVKGTPYKWLDIKCLVETIVKGSSINQIRYFTARSEPRASDPFNPARQDVYFRALRTLPNLTIHEGNFQSHPKFMALVHPPPSGPKFAEVWRTEEKGSDVNLASYLLMDAFNNDYDQAVIITNDSDLCTPIAMVRNNLHLPVFVLCPENSPSKALRKVASAQWPIRKGPLQACQLPIQLRATNGRMITKPSSW